MRHVALLRRRIPSAERGHFTRRPPSDRPAGKRSRWRGRFVLGEAYSPRPGCNDHANVIISVKGRASRRGGQPLPVLAALTVADDGGTGRDHRRATTTFGVALNPDLDGGEGAGQLLPAVPGHQGLRRQYPGTRACVGTSPVSVGERLTSGFVFVLSAAYSSPRRPAGSDGHRSVAGPGVAPTTRHTRRDLGRGGGVSCGAGGIGVGLTPSTRLGRFERLPRERAGRLLSVRARSLRTQQCAKSQCQKTPSGDWRGRPFGSRATGPDGDSFGTDKTT